ncbi:unnamed protein product [Rotaria magnacalcarata]|uniref:Methyltransferase type 11 domain-containing protein n=2 Tax=Rotaria magnacalcarata TaxID=392030 RepID=A0A819KAC6_9BILA|nr:unnamed protein product [Rotaria magnacalcarata]CAF3867927.1 unnamed protein product [Rotaria magnacalcarata]CAF3942637.1 unnamed protein product [Rotaria magnacalcarata]
MTTNLPRVSVQDVLNCSFSVWYPIFEKYSIKSVILNLTDDVLEYLRSDEFYLPISANEAMDNMRQINAESSDEDDSWPDEDTCDDTKKKISFPELEQNIKDVLDEYNAVFPKLNWSSAKDARWMISDSRLKCTNLADIFLLLKSSDFITHDLCEPFKFCYDLADDYLSTIQYVLVLREWSALQPSKEFRCFIKNNQIIAISQRDSENYYEFIGATADQIVSNIVAFFHNNIQNKFPSTDFVIDIYRKDSNKLYIIDFNPWGPMTDSLLFDWPELVNLSLQNNNDKPEFRYVNSQHGIKPNSYTQYAMPKDIADISRERDINKLADVLSYSRRDDDLVIDIGCGTGQSTILLAPHFQRIIGYDISEYQIKKANETNTHSNINYKVIVGSDIPHEDSSLALVISAQAAHWFDLPYFYKEVKRTLKSNGVLALFGYAFVQVHGPQSEKLNEIITNFYKKTLHGYVQKESEEVYFGRYRDEKFRDPLSSTDFIRDENLIIKCRWSIQRLLGYITSWSGSQHFLRQHPASTAFDDLRLEIFKCLDIFDDEYELDLSFDIFILMDRKTE